MAPRDQPAPTFVHLERDDFLAHYWDYEGGQHVTILAPTQNGKTTLGFQLLRKTARHDRLPASVLVVKPRDKTVAKWRKDLDYGLARDYPPPRFPKRDGWLIWPRHSFDIDADEKHHSDVMRRAIMGGFQKGDGITFADEVLGLVDLGLKRELRRVHTQGAGMGNGLWVTSQRPFEMPQTAFSQAEHLFLGPTPDKRDRDRYREIGGVDPDHIEAAVMKLTKFQFLHIQRTGPTLCVVQP